MFVIEAWHWLVFGLVLIGAELFVTTFAMLMFGIAAVTIALLSWLFDLSFVTQVITWLILSAVLCALWFGLIDPKLKNKTRAGLGGEAWIGEIGFITRLPGDVTTGAQLLGRVRFTTPVLGADEWSCRVTEPVELGQRVVLKAFLGNEVLVEPVQSIAAPVN